MSLSAFEKDRLSPQEQEIILKSQQGYDDAKAKGDKGLMNSYHTRAEEIRRKHGFAGGGAGNQYIPVDTHRDLDIPQIDPYQSQWDSALGKYMEKLQNPEQYQNPYADQIQSILDLMENNKEYVPKYQKYIDQGLNQIFNSSPFDYNPDTDPSFQKFLENVKGSTQESYEDNIGGFADLSGGYISSWAESAANQAMEAMNLQAQEAVGQFEDSAYSKYQFETNDMYNKMNTVIGLENQSIEQFNASNENSIAFLKVLNNQSDVEYNRFRDRVSDGKEMVKLVMQLDERDFERYKFTAEQGWKKFQEEAAQYQMELDFKKNEWQEAQERTELAGYVMNQDSITLQLPTGTLSKSARERVEQMEDWYKKQDKALDIEMKKMSFTHEQDIEIENIQQGYNMQLLKQKMDYQDQAKFLQAQYENAMEEAKTASGEFEGLSDEEVKAKAAGFSKSKWKTIQNYLDDYSNFTSSAEFQKMSKDDKYKSVMDWVNKTADLAHTETWGKDTPYMAAWAKNYIEASEAHKDVQTYRETSDKENVMEKQYLNNQLDRIMNRQNYPMDEWGGFGALKAPLEYQFDLADMKKEARKEVSSKYKAFDSHGNIKPTKKTTAQNKEKTISKASSEKKSKNNATKTTKKTTKTTKKPTKGKPIKSKK